MEITGKIIYVNPTTDKSKKEKPFLTREIGLMTTDVVNFQEYKNYFGFQAVQDKCAKFDNINIGDIVKIDFAIRGNLTKDEKKEGTEKNPNSEVIFMSLTAYDVVVITPATQAAPVATNTTTKPSPETNSGAVGDDDLPF